MWKKPIYNKITNDAKICYFPFLSQSKLWNLGRFKLKNMGRNTNFLHTLFHTEKENPYFQHASFTSTIILISIWKNL